MGIFDFIKSAGAALGLANEDTPPAAEDLKKELDSHNLGTDKVTVDVVGDKAVIKGEVSDQSTLEKAIVAIGNTLGIAQVETDIAVPDAPKEAPVFHTVEKGDTLWKIAETHYGNGSKYDAIFDANKPMLTHPDKIYPGQALRIPKL